MSGKNRWDVVAALHGWLHSLWVLCVCVCLCVCDQRRRCDHRLARRGSGTGRSIRPCDGLSPRQTRHQDVALTHKCSLPCPVCVCRDRISISLDSRPRRRISTRRGTDRPAERTIHSLTTVIIPHTDPIPARLPPSLPTSAPACLCCLAAWLPHTYICIPLSDEGGSTACRFASLRVGRPLAERLSGCLN